MMNQKIKNEKYLFRNQQNCCGCGVCSIVCPMHAIDMQEDERGFAYPNINLQKCVGCEKCIIVCPFNNRSTKQPTICYAAINADKEQIMNSSSGGVFAAIAEKLIEMGYYVYGTANDFNNGRSYTYHKLVCEKEGIKELQGSKYVQSDFAGNLIELGNILRQGEKVLVTGTPCQISATKSIYSKYKEQIFTIDIICHGVPNQTVYNGYLDYLQKKKKNTVETFQFRAKENGWGLKGKIKWKTGTEEVLIPEQSSYYKFFLDGLIYRDSCYKCPFASQERVGDLTIGDFWGIKDTYPDLLKENGGKFDRKLGISCVVVNTTNGEKMIELCRNRLLLHEVEFEKIAARNTQLREPIKSPSNRELIFTKYEKKGYVAVEKEFQKIRFIKRLKRKFRKMIPSNLKSKIVI